jgi:hypothetical protein
MSVTLDGTVEKKTQLGGTYNRQCLPRSQHKKSNSGEMNRHLAPAVASRAVSHLAVLALVLFRLMSLSSVFSFFHLFWGDSAKKNDIFKRKKT